MSIRKPEIGQRRLMPLLPEIRSIDEAKRTIEFVASTETEDRHGDIIRVAGWRLDNYLKNPVFLWAHRSSDPPIGRTVEVCTETSPPALVHTVEFADRGTYPFADTIYRLYKGKFLNATSVGFMPLEPPKKRYDEDEEFIGYEFTGQELLELSGVPVPANQDALARACQKGIITEGDIRAVEKCGEENAPWSFCVPGVTYPADEEPTRKRSTMVVPEMPKEKEEMMQEEATQKQEIEEAQAAHAAALEANANLPLVPVVPVQNLDAETQAARRAEIFAADAEDAALEPQLQAVMGAKRCSERVRRAMQWMEETDRKLAAIAEQLNSVLHPSIPAEEKTACPYRKEKLAERGYPWDAAAEMAKVSEPVGWKRMSTVIVGDPENKTSYKLPHHRGNDYATVYRGVANALARFEQTQMPSEDRSPARRHLLRHQAEFQSEEAFDLENAEQKMEILGNAYRALMAVSHEAAAAYFDGELQAMWTVAEAEPPKAEETPDNSLRQLLSRFLNVKVS